MEEDEYEETCIVSHTSLTGRQSKKARFVHLGSTKVNPIPQSAEASEEKEEDSFMRLIRSSSIENFYNGIVRYGHCSSYNSRTSNIYIHMSKEQPDARIYHMNTKYRVARGVKEVMVPGYDSVVLNQSMSILSKENDKHVVYVVCEGVFAYDDEKCFYRIFAGLFCMDADKRQWLEYDQILEKIKDDLKICSGEHFFAGGSEKYYIISDHLLTIEMMEVMKMKSHPNLRTIRRDFIWYMKYMIDLYEGLCTPMHAWLMGRIGRHVVISRNRLHGEVVRT